MNVHNMEYNSEKSELIIPEYGRNVQMLIGYAKTIEDDEYRQAFVERIINLMQQMHPQSKNLEDYREKLWKHVFRIADYDINVLPPSGEAPLPEDYRKKPSQVPYPSKTSRFRHYGHNVQTMINRALEMEEGPVKDGFIGVIGSYMKLAYRTWNREHYVSDDIIKEDLVTLSEGKLALKEDAFIDGLANAKNRRRRDKNDKNDRDRRGRRNNNHKRSRR